MKMKIRMSLVLILVISMVFPFVVNTLYVQAVADDAARSAIRLAAGDSHSMAIKSDNSLWVWGENTFGQLGTGRTTRYESMFTISENNDLYVPTKLLDNIVEIAAGRGFSLALNENGELFAWGKNDNNQLGDGTVTSSATPKKIMDNVVYVDACGQAAVAIKEDNSLWAWGYLIYAYDYATGTDAPIRWTQPTKIMDNVRKATVGEGLILMLDFENRVYGIGRESYLGINVSDPNTATSSPQIIMSQVRDIASGSQHGYAIDINDNLYRWGINIGSPVFVADNLKKVFTGGSANSLFLKNDDTLWITGSFPHVFAFRATVDNQGFDAGGTLLDDNVSYGNIPVKILDNIHIAFSGRYHFMAVDMNLNLYTWGNNQFGELGNGRASKFGAREYDEFYGYVDFYFVENNQALAPAIVTSLLATPSQQVPESITVHPTPSTVYVNGAEVSFEAYLIGGNNYFKLRDLAYQLNSTQKQFSVGYNDTTRAITLTSGEAYAAVGGEMARGDGTQKNAFPTQSTIYLDGVVLDLVVYNINGNNFFKLRDLMEAIDVYVGYDDATRAITLDSNRSYVPEGESPASPPESPETAVTMELIRSIYEGNTPGAFMLFGAWYANPVEAELEYDECAVLEDGTGVHRFTASSYGEASEVCDYCGEEHGKAIQTNRILNIRSDGTWDRGSYANAPCGDFSYASWGTYTVSEANDFYTIILIMEGWAG